MAAMSAKPSGAEICQIRLWPIHHKLCSNLPQIMDSNLIWCLILFADGIEHAP
jgi:hypothetical protein